MPTEIDLLLEKRRYDLEEKINKNEQEMLKKGYPVQKIIGYVDFFDTRIYVNKNVLIPRYETEELVHLFYFNERSNISKNKAEILDLCAGSGCIGLSLKNNLEDKVSISLSDIDEEAIQQIKYNAESLSLNVDIIKSDLFTNIDKKFDYIIANPPYIPFDEKLSKSVTEFEPHNALYAKDNGFYFYQQILNNIQQFLNKKGKLYLEISDHIYQIMINKNLPFNIKYYDDINGKKRFAIVNF